MKYAAIIVSYIFLLNSGAIFNVSDESVARFNIFMFAITICFIALLLKKELNLQSMAFNKKDIKYALFIAVAAYLGQIVLSRLLGVSENSQNTIGLIAMIYKTPLFIFVPIILAPVVEEVVFRKVLFGQLNKRFYFFVSALCSSILFSIVHFDFSHFYIYVMLGFLFSFAYMKTKKIIVSIASHSLMNTFVLLYFLF